MVLILTAPNNGDYHSFCELIKDKEIFKRFELFQNKPLDWCEKYINNWIQINKQGESLRWMKLIKIAESKNADEYYTDKNSTLIGFILHNDAGALEVGISGFKMLLNYGIIQKYRGKGIMTMALKLRLQRLYELKYNIISAYIEADNLESRKVLLKCGFNKVSDNDLGESYVKRIYMDESTFRKEFNL